MRILITAVSAASHISGVQRHAFNMVRCLLLNREVEKVYLVLAPWQREMANTAGLAPGGRLSIHYEEMARSSAARNLWYYRELPALVSRLQPDLLHLSYPVPVSRGAIACPIVLTLHDLYPYEIPRNFGPHQFLFNRFILRQCLRSVDAIACVSETTLKMLAHYAPSEVDRKASRIYNCVESESTSANPSPFPGWTGEPFLLTVAQHRRNKNIPLLIRVFKRLLQQEVIAPATRLLVVGIKGPETKLIESTVSRLGLGGSVVFLEGVTEPELQWCYAHSAAVVLPSSTEGFGLPLAEALIAGCRTVCSDIPAFREIGGSHCEFVPLKTDAEENLIRGIKAVLRKPAMNPVAFPHLSAQVLAREYLSLYRRFLPAAPSAKSSICALPLHLITAERQ